MTASELDRFLKWEVPRIRQRYAIGHYLSVDGDEVLSAFDAAVGLLKRALYDLEDADFEPGDGSCFDDLRLVVGEKKTG